MAQGVKFVLQSRDSTLKSFADYPSLNCLETLVAAGISKEMRRFAAAKIATPVEQIVFHLRPPRQRQREFFPALQPLTSVVAESHPRQRNSGSREFDDCNPFKLRFADAI